MSFTYIFVKIQSITKNVNNDRSFLLLFLIQLAQTKPIDIVQMTRKVNFSTVFQQCFQDGFSCVSSGTVTGEIKSSCKMGPTLKIILFITILHICLTYAENDTPQPHEGKSHNRMLSSQDVSLTDYTWMAKLLHTERYHRYEDEQYFCSGALIAPKHVITAASCFDKNSAQYQVTAVLGSYHTKKWHPREQRIVSDTHTIHRAYDVQVKDDVTVHLNDIALIRLEREAKLNWLVSIIPIATLGMRYDEEDATFVSWGSNSMEQPSADNLKSAHLKVMPHGKCDEGNGTYKGRIVPGMLCTYAKQDQDNEEEVANSACRGDGGGSLAYKGKHSEEWTLIGILSFFGKDCKDDTVSGVFMEIGYYNGWIEANLNKVEEAEYYEDDYKEN